MRLRVCVVISLTAAAGVVASSNTTVKDTVPISEIRPANSTQTTKTTVTTANDQNANLHPEPTSVMFIARAIAIADASELVHEPSSSQSSVSFDEELIDGLILGQYHTTPHDSVADLWPSSAAQGFVPSDFVYLAASRRTWDGSALRLAWNRKAYGGALVLAGENEPLEVREEDMIPEGRRMLEGLHLGMDGSIAMIGEKKAFTFTGEISSCFLPTWTFRGVGGGLLILRCVLRSLPEFVDGQR